MNLLNKYVLMAIPALWAVAANAEPLAEEQPAMPEKTSSLKANLKRLALKYTQNSVTNREEDENYPDFSSDEETMISGVFDGNLEYNNANLVWINSLFMEYGKTKTTEGNTTTSSEKDDQILLTSDYIHKMWNLEQGVVGPFASLGYETEFTTFEEDGEDYRTKIVRAKAGIKLYDGTYFKDLYLAAVEEADFTYDDSNMKTAAETGYAFEYQLREGVKFISDGYYRQYFVYDMYKATDYKYELKFNNRLGVALAGGFSLAPFADYHMAKTRGARKSRSDTTVGVALEYHGDYLFR
ncbi:MAG: DUF3078 domain-containing protein [Alphaproteobacteria bacterium]|nr:DUF3078 domain-containing protein [Alphaproteobacteria bacterium]